MSLTKEHFIRRVSGVNGLPKQKSRQLVESLLEILKSTLESGESVLISGFGRFSVLEKGARRGRNPQTGNDLVLDARRVVTFKCSGVLRERMNEDRLEDYVKNLEKAKQRCDTVVETIEFKRDNIAIEAETIWNLEIYKRNQEFIIDAYGNIPRDVMESMDDAEFQMVSQGLVSASVSGEAAYRIHDETLGEERLYGHHRDVSASLASLSGSDSTSVVFMLGEEPQWCPDLEEIAMRHNIEDKTDTHIDSIREHLEDMFPEILEDFDAFLLKFRAVAPGTSQYQDLSGARGMFFWKMIFGFSEQRYGAATRREKIEKFVFGSGTPLRAAEPIINSCFQIWSELSSQNPSGMSVKLGNVTPGYVQGLFRKLLASIASLLELRERYFRP